MFERYPLKVMIFKKYGNVLKPVLDSARYEKRRFRTEEGIVEQSYLILKNEKAKIPAQEISFYYDIENAKWIYLLQVDRYTFYPISFEDDKMEIIYPIYQRDEQGNIIKDEKGNPKIEYVKKTLFDSTIVVEEGKIVKLPMPITHKTYDKEYWLSNEIETAYRLYRSRNFWEKYGSYVMFAVVGILLIMFFYVGVSKYAELTSTIVKGLESVSQSLNSVADKLSSTAQALGAKTTVATTPPY